MDYKIKPDYDHRFVNPYNFIPLGDKCRREIPKINDDNSYTGYFDCSMRILTPLFIPNTSSSVRLLEKKEWDINKDEFKGYDFFSYDDWSKEQPYLNTPPLPPCNPVIPGSEIRGSVRSVYEAAFNGCMSSVDGDRDISRRCGEVKIPGILYWDKENKGWYLKKCRKARLRVEQIDEQETGKNYFNQVSRGDYDHWKEGQEIWVKIGAKNLVTDHKVNVDSGNEERMKSKGFVKGYLHKGEFIQKKSCETVFCEYEKTKENSVRDEDIRLLQRVLDEYKDRKKNCKIKDNGWYEDFKVSKDNKRILVYYAKDNKNRVYMCPACIGREALKKTVGSLLKNNGNYQPCSNELLCPACQIFGMMDKQEKTDTYAYGSRVRITDAVLIHSVTDSRNLFEEPIVLPELGEPRPGAVEFYTETPYSANEMPDENNMQGYWTYDYKYKYNKEKKNSVERIVLNKNQPKIRGRKYYWHSEVDMDEFNGNKVNLMRQRIRPLKPNEAFDSEPTFQFRVYFEQLDKKQIQQLKWALDFGCPDCAHKIGRGKPLGFGSVQILVDRIHLREIDGNTGSWNITTVGEDGGLSFGSFFEASGFTEKEIPETLKIMSNWKKRPMNVMYPLGEDNSLEGKDKENSHASHQWFKLNKVKQNNFNHNFCKILPEAIDDAKEKPAQNKALYKLVRNK